MHKLLTGLEMQLLTTITILRIKEYQDVMTIGVTIPSIVNEVLKDEEIIADISKKALLIKHITEKIEKKAKSNKFSH